MSRYGCLFVLMSLLFLVSGCASSQEVTMLIGISQADSRDVNQLIMAEEIKEEAERYPQMQLIFLDAGGDERKQVRDIEKLRAFGVDLMIVSPIASPQVFNALEGIYQVEEIPTIIIDKMPPNYQYSLFIGYDKRFLGYKVAEVMERSGYKDGTKILEIGLSNPDYECLQMTQGFREGLLGETVKYIGLEKETKDLAEDKLMEHQEVLDGIDAIFAHTEYIARGVEKALAQLGLKEEIEIISMESLSSNQQTIDLIEERIAQQVIVCPVGGRVAVKQAVAILDQLSGVPKQIILRPHHVNVDNVERYFEENHYTKKENTSVKVGYSQIGVESDFRKANTKSIRAAAQKFGINLIFRDANQSQESQIEHIREFIAMDVDVIVLTPVVDTGWREILKEAKAAKIPVILSDRKITAMNDALYTMYVGGDFIEEGKQAMRLIAEEMVFEGEAVCIFEIKGSIGATPTVERSKGFREMLKQYNKYKITYTAVGNYTFEGGKRAILNYAQDNEWGIDVIYAHNDDMALGAIEALEELGLVPGKDVKVVSIDGTKKALQAIQKGKLEASIECSPLLGEQLMKGVSDLLSGDELPISIITDKVIFTKENAKKYVRNRPY